MALKIQMTKTVKKTKVKEEFQVLTIDDLLADVNKISCGSSKDVK